MSQITSIEKINSHFLDKSDKWRRVQFGVSSYVQHIDGNTLVLVSHLSKNFLRTFNLRLEQFIENLLTDVLQHVDRPIKRFQLNIFMKNKEEKPFRSPILEEQLKELETDIKGGKEELAKLRYLDFVRGSVQQTDESFFPYIEVENPKGEIGPWLKNINIQPV